MADTKVSGLTAAGAVVATNIMLVIQAGVSTSATMSSAQTFMFTSPTFAAGTSGQDAFSMTSGAVLTTAAAGAFEFDGTNFYATALSSARQIIPATQFVAIAGSDYTLATTSNLSQAVFPAAADVWTVASSTSYFIEGVYYISKSGGTATIQIGFSGSYTMTNIMYYAIGHEAAVNATTATQGSVVVFTSANTAVTATGTTAAVVNFNGIISVNAGGTFIPTIVLNSTTTSPLTKVGSYIKLTACGSNGANVTGAYVIGNVA